jgi:hypothetical protein
MSKESPTPDEEAYLQYYALRGERPADFEWRGTGSDTVATLTLEFTMDQMVRIVRGAAAVRFPEKAGK